MSKTYKKRYTKTRHVNIETKTLQTDCNSLQWVREASGKGGSMWVKDYNDVWIKWLRLPS
jgi:hypothetical protein